MFKVCDRTHWVIREQTNKNIYKLLRVGYVGEERGYCSLLNFTKISGFDTQMVMFCHVFGEDWK